MQEEKKKTKKKPEDCAGQGGAVRWLLCSWKVECGGIERQSDWEARLGKEDKKF